MPRGILVRKIYVLRSTLVKLKKLAKRFTGQLTPSLLLYYLSSIPAQIMIPVLVIGAFLSSGIRFFDQPPGASKVTLLYP